MTQNNHLRDILTQEEYERVEAHIYAAIKILKKYEKIAYDK